MELTPYTTTFAGHITHYCQVTLADGRTLDLKSPTGELDESAWRALAEQVLMDEAAGPPAPEENA